MVIRVQLKRYLAVTKSGILRLTFGVTQLNDTAEKNKSFNELAKLPLCQISKLICWVTTDELIFVSFCQEGN